MCSCRHGSFSGRRPLCSWRLHSCTAVDGENVPCKLWPLQHPVTRNVPQDIQLLWWLKKGRQVTTDSLSVDAAVRRVSVLQDPFFFACKKLDLYSSRWWCICCSRSQLFWRWQRSQFGADGCHLCLECTALDMCALWHLSPTFVNLQVQNICHKYC